MSAPLLDALRPVPGSLRLIVSRWLLSIFAGLPGIVAGKAALSESIGTKPWFAEAVDPLPLPQFFGVLGEVGSVLPMMLIGVLFAWLFLQLLTAAAVDILDPSRRAGRVRLWRTMIDTGGRHFLAYLRISLFALIFLGIGGRIFLLVYARLVERGVVEGWSGKTLVFTMPVAATLFLLGWAGLMGTCALWGRVITVRGNRRYVRRTLLMVPRVIWRNPVQGLMVHWLMGIGFVLSGAAMLVAWRQAPGVATGWFIAWLLLLLVQSAVWHWRMRTLSLIWSQPGLDDLRSVPDAPWGLFRRVRDRFRRKPASVVVQE